MQHTTRYVLIGLFSLSLAGCANNGGFNSESGSAVDNGTFGNATMNNMLLQTGQVSYTQALGERFAAEVPSTVTFAFNSDVLDATAMAALDQQANWIRQFPELRFSVYGHTDLVGSNAYNEALGKRRAQAVVAYLGSRGISRSRLDALVSFGKTQPVIATPEPEQRNRRTVTEVSGFVKNHPALLNGKYAAVIMRTYIDLARRPHPANVVVETQIDPGG
jgi:outer membrane protein OmpA-like peptidoglycan-associated protein